ncbi:DUF4145 domain-containing protein [Priestia aryabhattai]|uniref:DUF4145 domain-containing protein n=1 Tax=Priestia aryabhattai TaxID=412384 RepID=UPI0023AEE8D0|nr:DUF4145 domain-containing protein [Priestia aryabhattai]MDE8674688.1 DUF4145 domain-containing protein [Priestia aryabhattai]
MSKEIYVAPELGLESFNCPECRAYSHQEWIEVIYTTYGDKFQLLEFTDGRIEYAQKGEVSIISSNHQMTHITAFSRCHSCKSITIWKNNNMVYPQNLNVEPPNPDMPKDIESLYNEARSIAHLSPRSAAALLRLALEKLLICLGAQKGTIDSMIQSLIKKDIISPSGHVRKALDTIREIGNAGVHPTSIDLDENPKASFALFKVINFVVEKMITDQKTMDEIYNYIPKEKREKLDVRRGVNSNIK